MKPNSIPGITKTSFFFSPPAQGPAMHRAARPTQATRRPWWFPSSSCCCWLFAVDWWFSTSDTGGCRTILPPLPTLTTTLGSARPSSPPGTNWVIISYRCEKRDTDWKTRLFIKVVEGYVFLIICHKVSPFCSVWRDL